MRDEIDGRLWQEHGTEFTAFLARAFDELMAGFIRLHEIEFDAPWRRSATPDRS